ncbi:MAG TPA: DUF2934 domain-containing protein [Aliidongia sp.]|uniref:DUF2934 domain-containing protein n=1 Tax=Aliidongia sp. TaxID=1914230 RepID=UPI002DDD17D1|nr:DUF2934 domain-containing protein [Aliidongia sp.]HEV2676144.1 DUF2934 domain-containing protein [Aliidongia sp.]
MSAAYDEYEARVRARAHEIWVREGKPEGRADSHWDLARVEVASEENIETTLKPIEDGPDAEPLLAVDGMADLPGRLSDQGERQDYPSAPTAKPRKAGAAKTPAGKG